jgi:hypothetical protein
MLTARAVETTDDCILLIGCSVGIQESTALDQERIQQSSSIRHGVRLFWWWPSAGYGTGFVLRRTLWWFQTVLSFIHKHTHTHTHIYIYIYIYLLNQLLDRKQYLYRIHQWTCFLYECLNVVSNNIPILFTVVNASESLQQTCHWEKLK